MKKNIIVSLLVVIWLLGGCAGPDKTLAPDFELKDLEGNQVTLRDFRGSPVMINFWATWCAPCRYEMPFIQAVFESWQSKGGLVILAINRGESLSPVQDYLQSEGYTFPVLLDGDEKVNRAYNISGIPTTVFIDEEGVIKARHAGPFNNAEELENYLSGIM